MKVESWMIKEEVEIVEEEVMKPLTIMEKEEDDNELREIDSWTKWELVMLEKPETSPLIFTSLISFDNVGNVVEEVFFCEQFRWEIFSIRRYEEEGEFPISSAAWIAKIKLVPALFSKKRERCVTFLKM